MIGQHGQQAAALLVRHGRSVYPRRKKAATTSSSAALASPAVDSAGILVGTAGTTASGKVAWRVQKGIGGGEGPHSMTCTSYAPTANTPSATNRGVRHSGRQGAS